MTELAIDVLGETINGEFQLDEAKLHKAIAEYKVGSFLNAPGPVAQSPEKWNEIIGRIQELSMAPKHVIPVGRVYGKIMEKTVLVNAIMGSTAVRGFKEMILTIFRRPNRHLRETLHGIQHATYRQRPHTGLYIGFRTA